jgi:hypothetical protein
MTRRRVVIFDDEDRFRENWVARLREVPGFEEEFEALTAKTDAFGADLKVLYNRRLVARQNREVAVSAPLFDETDILIIDYDLLELNETGEEVAYLARCFSQCGTIIAVNQFAKEGFTFDLTLQGHPDSYADLNLLSEQLFDPGLWSTVWGEVRPWYWPLLPKAVEAFKERVQAITGNLDEKILDFLEIPKGVREIFPVSALEFIASRDTPSNEATFRTFVVESGKALRGKDKVVSEEAYARIAAARISKWLERLVLPGQSILVDAAHLLERYPSLFKGGAPDQLIGWSHPHELMFPDESILDTAKIEPHCFAKSAWLSRTAWYWPLVSEEKEISEVVNPWAPRTRLAFCEDTSRFVNPDVAEEFVARVDSPFVRRFASKRDLKYGPQLQFAL